MMQAMGIPPTGAVAVSVAQRGVLQNPGGATGNLGGAAAAGTIARRSLGQRSRMFNGEIIAARQVQQLNGGTPTNNNPVATQLLLAPTFTPIQANAIIDQTNMRIAIPVRQVDGEFILTMQKMEGATPATPQQPAAAEPQAPKAEAGGNNGTATPGEAVAAKPEGEKKAERRQSTEKDKYGNAVPPQGAVIMTMKMVDEMVDRVQWAGQAPITKMMSEYVKAQTGRNMGALN